jgi:hypothetical protein
MYHDVDHTPLSELRRNAVATAVMLLAVSSGALAVVALLDVW